MVYVIQVCWQLASRIRTEVLSWACSHAVWHIPLLCLQWKTSDDGQRNSPKHVEFYSKNKLEKLVHLVGFIIRIYHDARSPECQILQRHISAWIIVQQDATVFSLLYFCRQLYMFRVLTPIIRSSYSCSYSFWHRSTGSGYHPLSFLSWNSTMRADGTRPGWPVPEAVITAVPALDDGCLHPKHVELPTEM